MNESSDASLKQCSKCPNSYPATLEFFSRCKNMKDGLRPDCKSCGKAYQRSRRVYRKEWSAKYYQEHREELLEQQKRYNLEHREDRRQYSQTEKSKAYKKERNAKYHQEHREEQNEQRRQHYVTNREHHLERQRNYLRTLRGRMVDKAHKHKRKAQKRASKGSYTSQQLQEQFSRQKGKCYYCKVKLHKIWHADHVIPLSRGGSNDIHNIVVTCPDCNMHKYNKLPHEWPEGNRLL